MEANTMVTVAIQAGGRSSRMGRDKGLVELAGKRLIEHVLAAVDGLADEVLITTNAPERYREFGRKTATDPVPGAGALPGLHTALSAAAGDHVLVVACDMPFLNRALLTYLLAARQSADVVVPLWGGYHQTMHAVYAREPVLAAVEAALASGQKRMTSFYAAVRVLEVPDAIVGAFDPMGHTFFNVNTPADLAEAEAILHRPHS
jgi:molybdopterin-guanine dinucleotide biosynthesis protein A